jgi:polysaccharide pyruvyl transferase WcaK-like protein
MHVALVNVWSDHNRGDAAIVHATYHAIKRRFPDAVIDLHNVVFGSEDTARNYREHFASFDKLETTVFPAIFPGMHSKGGQPAVSQPRRVAYGIRALAMLLLARIRPSFGRALLGTNERAAYQSLTHADLILSKGGSYLLGNGWKSSLQITMVMFPLVLAAIAGKRTALLGVSVGPARSRVAAAVMGYWFRWLDLIVVREQDAYETCIRLGVSESKLILLPDFAFLLSTEGNPRPDEPNVLREVNRPRVAVTARSWRFDDAGENTGNERERNYHEGLANALRKFHLETGATILLVPQVIGPGKAGSDLAALNAIYSRLNPETPCVLLPDNLDYETLRAVYTNSDLLVGTRLHSVILGFGTPTVIIGYQGNKSIGTARLLGYEDAFVHINDVDADTLLNRMRHVWNSRERITAQAEHKRAEFTRQFDVGLERVFRTLVS